MPKTQKHTSSLRIQRGQAMIEYAILFILLTVLFIGGAEIGATALASYKNTDAAKVAANEFVEINQKTKTEIYDAQKEYLSKLAALGITEIDSNGTSSGTLIYDNYVEYLRALPDQNADNVIDEDDYLALFAQSQFNSIDTNNDDEITQAEANNASDSNSTNAIAKFKAIIILRQIALFDMPTLADHSNITNPVPIVSANCNGGTINYGLPNRYPYDDLDDNGVFELNSTGQIYLFHPQPIDITNCSSDQIGVLFNGSGKFVDGDGDGEDDDGDFFPGLPKLNQAMYGLYTRVCVDAANEYVSCNVPANVSRTLLKPPGKICFENGGANADSCQGQPDEVTGFYHWGQSGTNINVADELNNGFRPAFQLDCAFQSNYASSDVFDTNCNSNPSKVRIHTRYRSVFEGFLNFGVQQLQSDAAVSLFYNPNNVSRCGTAIIGGPGSEIGYLTSINKNDCNRNGFPTLKPHKDFRGCYEVDVETNQVSACS